MTALLLSSLLLPVQARENFIVESGVMRDAAGQAEIDQASRADYQLMPAVLAVGFTTDTCWIRLKIKPPNGVGELVLRIRPAYLDDLRLYAPDASAPGGWRVSQAGDRYSQGLRERPGAVHNLPLHGLSGETTVYLRIRSASNLQFYAEALTERDADEADNLQTGWFGLYFGMMLALLGWALVDYQASGDRVLGWFIPYQIVSMLYGASVTGYLAWLLPVAWSDHADMVTSLLVLLVPLLGMLCNRALFQALRASRWGIRLLSGLLLLPPLEMLALWLGHVQPALIVNAVLVLLLGPLLFIISLTITGERTPQRWLLRGVYAVLALHLTIAVLPVLGLVDAVAWRLHISLIQGLLTGLLIFALLHLRARELLRGRQQAVLELQVAHQRAELERLEKEEKSRFMTMLTHELHSPMLVMRLIMAQVEGDSGHRMDLLGRSNMHQALRDMEKLIDRCLQVDRVEQIEQAAAREPFALGPVLADVVDATSAPARVVVSMRSMRQEAELRSDETLFCVVVGNLLDNALKYSAEGSSVELRVEEAEQAQADGQAGGRRLLLRVANTPGKAGVPDPNRAFQKYYRAPGARVQRGTGLGLWLVRAISRHLGGDTTLRLEDGRVIFEVDLPFG